MEFNFTLTGRTPLLMSADNIDAADELDDWRKDPDNKKVSVKGDDRSPPWSWMARLHHDEINLVMPSDVIMAILREAGKKMTLKGMLTFKGESQSALFIEKQNCDLLIGGKQVSYHDILAMKTKTFAEQAKAVQVLGFRLHKKRVKLKGSANVRVRACFDQWVVKGHIEIVDTKVMTEKVLNELFAIGGLKCGMLDWRPNARSPGTYGQFDHKLVAVV